MFLLLLPAVLVFSKVEPKEEICFHLSTAVVHQKREEIEAHNKLHDHLSPSHVKIKLIEETFKRCMNEIKPQEVKMLMEDKNSIMSYSSYYAASIGDLDCQEALEVDSEFFETRGRISEEVFREMELERISAEEEAEDESLRKDGRKRVRSASEL